MKKETAKFLNISLVLVSVFCIFIFIFQTIIMSSMSEEAIRQLGLFYMTGMADQVTSHFGTIIELRLSQVESVVNSVPPGRTAGGSSMQIELSYNARSAGFEYLALYTGDGQFHMLYGSQVTPDVPEDIHHSVQEGRKNVCAGVDEAGTPIVLVGVPARYPMEDGGTSMALVAGLPTSSLSGALESNLQSGIIGFSILRDDGSYVMTNSDIPDRNYFDRVERTYGSGGKNPEQYARELRAALENDVDYASEVVIEGERWNIYCTDLPNSQWHLLLKISHSTLDETVNDLQRRWSVPSIGGCILIVLALLLVFMGYYRLTKMQMKALDEALQNAERANRAKNEFLSNMSHDIRTPMNGIMGMTSIAIGSLDDPPRVRSCLRKIHISSRHLLGLLNDILDMSKIEGGSLTLNLEPVSLREIAENIMIIMQPQVREKNQSFNIYLHKIYHENVCADRVRLSQILLNIIGNSVKFTPEGGSIRADLYEEPSPKGSGYIRSHLHITDNGIGMSKEFQTKVFEAFSREDHARVEKEAGAGMGLAITKHIVDALDGTIELDSEQGKGTHFHIIIDMELGAAREKELRLPARDVLVVDGDQLAAELAVEALESIGLRAEAAYDLDGAYRKIEERPKSQPYHLILLDHDTDGQDGVSAAREMSARFGKELPVVLLTDGDWDELEVPAESAGVRGFITKPLFRTGLYFGLRSLLEGAEELAQPQEEAGPGGPDLAGLHILIAEDNEMNWEIASELLREYGLEMEWAENGQICVEKFAASQPGDYDAILMDLRMPVKNGLEAAVAIRALDHPDAQTVPIIAISADAFQDDIQNCLSAGMNAHTPKPLDPEKVLALLGQLLGHR